MGSTRENIWHEKNKEPKTDVDVKLHFRYGNKLYFRDGERVMIWQRRLRRNVQRGRNPGKCGIMEVKGGQSCGSKDMFNSTEYCREDK